MSKIVILGSGFGGAGALLTLSKRIRAEDEIIVVSKSKEFVFVPLVHEVIAGTLRPNEVTAQLDSIGKCRFIQDEVLGVDFSSKLVKGKKQKIKYDYLLIALGSVPNKGILGNNVDADRLVTLKTLADALEIRNKLTRIADERLSKNNWHNINILIIGAGATGVELAGELKQFFNNYLNENGVKNSDDCIAIQMTEKSDRIISYKNEKFRNSLSKRLEYLGINVMTKASVLTFDGKKAKINSGSKVINLDVSIAFLTAGVVPLALNTFPKITNGSGAFDVNENLEIKNTENAWAVGDISSCSNPFDKMPVPMLAQSAYDEGKFVGKNISAKIKGERQKIYRFRSKGFLLSVSKWYCVGDIYGVTLSGFLLWWIKRMAYAAEFPGFFNKIKAMWRFGIVSLFR